MTVLGDAVKEFGFEDEQEFYTLVSKVDISSPRKNEAFKKWQDEDGTKEGLLKLFLKKEE